LGTTTLPRPAELLQLLRARRAGDAAAGRTLFEGLYAELHALARRRMARERAGHTLGATSLVHEVYLRLEHAGLPELERDEFLRLAAAVMRRILVDSARRKALARRAAAEVEPRAESAAPEERLLRLDAALEQLAACDPELSRLVELRFLVGLDLDETARVLGLSRTTLKRDWRTARAFLQRHMEGTDGR
jgi:RNA polymerase sigma factor (TIGR02999 family)